MAYCIDTSAILDGWVRYYPRDVFPTLWDRLEKMIASGRLVAPDEVLRELSKNDDDLHKWALLQEGLFCPLEDDVQTTTSDILRAFPKLVSCPNGSCDKSSGVRGEGTLGVATNAG